MIEKTLKIDFVDFWEGFDKTDNYFYNLLKKEFNIEISKEPDYLFFSVFSLNHLNYKCKKIFYTGENFRPPLHICDYAFSFDYIDDPKHYRLPHYLLYDGYYELANKKVDESLLNRKFCNFIVSNSNYSIRNTFFSKLSKYKKVDSGGRYLNNIGGPISNGRWPHNVNNAIVQKRKFQSEYKFSIAFENSVYMGYTTEKILDPMTVNSIPLYLGNPRINEEFNAKSFVSFTNFSSMEEMINYVIELDKDDKKYFETLKNPWFTDNIVPANCKIDNIKKFLYSIFL